MNHKRTSLSAEKLLGRGQVLPHLQRSIAKAQQSILIVGPWLDAYFVGKIINSLADAKIDVHFIVRIDGDEQIDSKTLSALNLAREKIPEFQAKTLQNLHSKVIIIDREVFYLGSTNWYWYSLHESLELTVTGKTSFLPEIITEMDNYWESATPINSEDLKEYRDYEPITTDIHLKFL